MKLINWTIIFFSLLVILFSPLRVRAQYSEVPIGGWRDHLSYFQTNKIIEVEDRLLVSAGSALFFYDRDEHSVERLSKVNGLTDAGVGQIAYDRDTKTIVIVYDNSNIDLIHNDKVYNIPDINLRSIEGSKQVNNITFFNRKAYLSCGFGIVVLDLERREIYDTYYIGNNSSKIRVNSVVIDNDSIYAATVNGLLFAPINSFSLATSETWKKYESFKNDNNSEVNFLLKFNNRLIAGMKVDNDLVNLYERKDNVWDTAIANHFVYWVKATGDYLVIHGWGSINQAVFIYDTTYTLKRMIDNQWGPIILEDSQRLINPSIGDAIIKGNSIWMAHRQEGGLLFLDNFLYGAIVKPIYPNGPFVNSVFSITATKDNIYVSPGGRTMQSAPRGHQGDVYTFDRFNWKYLSNSLDYPDLKDILSVSVDPRNKNHLMAASWWSGVVEILDNRIVKIWDDTSTNNVLTQTYGYRIAGAEYDASGNLIIANSLSSTALCYLNYHNQWGGFNTFDNIGQAEVLGLLLDSTNYGNFYKFIWTYQNDILAIDNNNNQILINPNNGSKSVSNKVNCMVQDQRGEIWIGTDKGVKVIYSLDNLFEVGENNHSAITCNNIICQEDGIAQYLLNFDNVNCIMVDGANQKWIGTERNGVFVFSPDGDKQLNHFTAENSPLFANKVIAMAQDPLTGEVYIGTEKGLISYRASSTMGKEKAGGIKVFPNPVKPEYNGIIAMNGFVKDSDVRITDISGNMVAHLKSVGGQATWDGKDFKGNRVSSGVYLIFSSAAEGKENAVGKILFVR
ncbi:MAG: hypothetical protein LBM25_06170 [Bacteroidales bacterium]|jgi:hypothetical protein|nr:hypothetical protein [Bacteroidales bacterium]